MQYLHQEDEKEAEVIKEWIKNIIVYMLFSSILYNMAPDKNYKKYIQFLSGIIMILIVLRPISFIFSFDGGRELSAYADSLNQFLEDGGDVYGEGIYDYYDMSIERAVEENLKEKDIYTENVSVTTDEKSNILRINIYISGEDASSDTEKQIKNLISEVYNLDEDSIYVIRQVR